MQSQVDGEYVSFCNQWPMEFNWNVCFDFYFDSQNALDFDFSTSILAWKFRIFGFLFYVSAAKKGKCTRCAWCAFVYVLCWLNDDEWQTEWKLFCTNAIWQAWKRKNKISCTQTLMHCYTAVLCSTHVQLFGV